jgi:hypothetical protein
LTAAALAHGSASVGASPDLVDRFVHRVIEVDERLGRPQAVADSSRVTISSRSSSSVAST